MEDNASTSMPPLPPPVTPPPPPVTPPPPLTPPPIIVPPPASTPRKGGRAWMIFALVLLVLLALSMASNIGHMASNVLHGKSPHARAVGPKLEEVITEDNDASEKIVVVEINGIIT